MCRFFFKTPTNSMMSFSLKTLSTVHKEFGLTHGPKHFGKIIKLSFLEKNTSLETSQQEIYNNIISLHKNCLFIGTTPTIRHNKDYLQSLYPGHNFSFITNDEGVVAASISKRPDLNKPLALQKRVLDHRLKEFPSTIRLYAPLYTPLQEDLFKWLERAKLVSGYPLYLHIFPIIPELGLDAHLYQSNVSLLLEKQSPYSLCSWIHPDSEQRLIRANNCNSDVQKAIFGLDIHEVQDMFCQEAALVMAKELAKTHEYLEVAEELGLTSGIEKSFRTSESYLPIFTA